VFASVSKTAQEASVASVVKNLPELPDCEGKPSTADQELSPRKKLPEPAVPVALIIAMSTAPAAMVRAVAPVTSPVCVALVTLAVLAVIAEVCPLVIPVLAVLAVIALVCPELIPVLAVLAVIALVCAELIPVLAVFAAIAELIELASLSAVTASLFIEAVSTAEEIELEQGGYLVRESSISATPTYIITE